MGSDLEIVDTNEVSSAGDAPDDVCDRASWLYANGIYGYQSPGLGVSKAYFMIAWCNDLTEEQVVALRAASGVESIDHGNFLGRGYLKIGWQDHGKITTVFNTMLEHGHYFATANRAKVYFDPAKDVKFTPVIMEQKTMVWLEGIRRDCMHNPTYWQPLLEVIVHENFTYPWNYITKAGKNACARLRTLMRLPTITEHHADNFHRYPIFQNYDHQTLQALPDLTPTI